MDSRRIQQVFQSRCVLQQSMQSNCPSQLMPAKFEANAANTKRRCCLDLFWSVWSACNIFFFPGLLCLDGCFAAAMSSCLLCPFCFSAFITQLQRRLYDLTTSSLGPPRSKRANIPNFNNTSCCLMIIPLARPQVFACAHVQVCLWLQSKMTRKARQNDASLGCRVLFWYFFVFRRTSRAGSNPSTHLVFQLHDVVLCDLMVRGWDVYIFNIFESYNWIRNGQQLNTEKS